MSINKCHKCTVIIKNVKHKHGIIYNNYVNILFNVDNYYFMTHIVVGKNPNIKLCYLLFMSWVFNFLFWIKPLEWERKEALWVLVLLLAAVGPVLRWRVWRWIFRDGGVAVAVDTQSSDLTDSTPFSPSLASFPLVLYRACASPLPGLCSKEQKKTNNTNSIMINHVLVCCIIILLVLQCNELKKSILQCILHLCQVILLFLYRCAG